jgi:hypothetical protein
MSRQPFLLSLVSAAAAAAVHFAPVAVAQSVASRRAEADAWTSLTPWGDPDLQGVWASDSATPFQRPAALGGRQFLTDAEVAALEKRAAELFDGEADAAFGDAIYNAVLSGAETNVSVEPTGQYQSFWVVDRRFENRTSLIVDPPDGRIPPLTAEAEARREQARQAARPKFGSLARLSAGDATEAPKPNGPEDIDDGMRCIYGGIPMTTRGYNSNYQIVQAPGYVAISMEMIHDARIIPLDDRPHASSAIRSRLGNSRGHWEGSTLVVETTNFTPVGQLSASTGEQLRLIERFTRENAETLRYEFTVEDPTTWTQPWTAAIYWTPAPGTGLMYEVACHEGNYAVVNTLQGARVQEAAAADAN